jgi:folate-binding protein YgfZ
MTYYFSEELGFSEIRLNGQAAIEFGHRMFSRSIRDLKLGAGALSAFLSPEGKVLETFWVVRMNEGLLLFVRTDRQQNLIDLLEKYHFAEAFSVEKGPRIAARWGESPRGGGMGELYSKNFIGYFRQTEFIFSLDESTATKVPAAPEVQTLHRIKSLLPEREFDFDESTLVFDLGFEELCDPDKGCYVGQEVVERVRTRGGHFPRRLASFQWTDEPSPYSVILDESGSAIGSTTTSVAKSEDHSFYSLGFLKRNSATPSTQVRLKDSPITGRVLSLI